MQEKNATFEGEELIEKLRHFEKSAMDRLYYHHLKSAANYMKKICTDDEIIKDVYHDALEVVYKKVLETEFKLSCDLQGYINRVCRNLLLNRISIEKKQREIENGEHLWKKEKFDGDNYNHLFEMAKNMRPNINKGISNEEDVTCLNVENVIIFNKVLDIMKNLSEKCYEIITRTFLQNESNEYVSDELGFKDKITFKSKKAKCLKQLKIEALKLQIHS